MKDFGQILGGIMLIIWWLAGVVLAQGFWSTFASMCFPPWAFYLVVEKFMIVAGYAA